MAHQLRVALIPAYLLLCLLLGGASNAGFWANMVLQLLGLAIIFWSLVTAKSPAASVPARQLVLLLVLMLTVALAQLVPLPPSIWAGLGGRQGVAEGYRLLGQTLPWLPISLDPHGTLSSVLWTIPAIAVVLGMIRLGGFKASWIAWTIAAVMLLSVGVGALQRAADALSGWYFYEITNRGFAVGFFANVNHQAMLLVCTIPFLAALYLTARAKGHSAQRASGLLVILAGALMVVLVGIAINASLAAYGLAIPALTLSLLMIWLRKRATPIWVGAIALLITAGAVAIPFSAPLGNDLTTEEAQETPISRATSFPKTLAAAGDYLPFGSGLGTFTDIYPEYEDPATIGRTYMNHAHSDYLELLLETGLPGMAVLGLFLLWWVSRTVAIWRSDVPDHFARAATIATAAVLAHSAVDYPLRTAAMSALFAACCVLMTEARGQVRRARKAPAADDARHLSAD